MELNKAKAELVAALGTRPVTIVVKKILSDILKEKVPHSLEERAATLINYAKAQ